MLKKIATVCGILVLLATAYLVGDTDGQNTFSKRQTGRDLELHSALVEIDRSFLTNVVTRPSTMTSGLYSLETRFTSGSQKVSPIELEFSNGQLIKASKLRIQDIVQTGSVVSWEQYEVDEGPSARFVGLIDGNMMWGRVYMEPGQGWRQGDPPDYGVWTVRRKSDK